MGQRCAVQTPLVIMRSYWLLISAALCWLITYPDFTHACGWWGDGGIDNDDVILVDSDNSKDDPQHQTRLGNNYKTGTGVARNYEMAAYWYLKAAEQGFPAAQNNLAVMYEQGLGVAKDESEAAKWYHRAAEGNDEKAQHSIGTMYRDGRGVTRDPEKAVKWIRKSAENGHPGAFRDMGEMYRKGEDVSQNYILAYMWLKLGGMYGDKESGRLLTMVASKMDSDSVAEAEKLAREWIEKHQ